MARDSRAVLWLFAGVVLYAYVHQNKATAQKAPRNAVATTAREWADLMFGPGAIVGEPATTRHVDNFEGRNPVAWAEQQRALTVRLSGRGA